jgi:hypothetical protein
MEPLELRDPHELRRWPTYGDIDALNRIGADAALGVLSVMDWVMCSESRRRRNEHDRELIERVLGRIRQRVVDSPIGRRAVEGL